MFHDHTGDAGVTPSEGSVGCVFGDYDNDGDVDLFVSNQSRRNQLFANKGDGSFLEIMGEGRFLGEGSVGAALFDFDNDGDLDLATTALSSLWGGDDLYLNRASHFIAIGALLKLPGEGSGRGLAVSDYDRDGDQDLLVIDTKGPKLYENLLFQTQVTGADSGGRDGSTGWLAVSLEGVLRNRQGLGAIVEMFTAQGMQRREVFGTHGYASQGSGVVHFGLGEESRVDSLRVLWPDGNVSLLTNMGTERINQLLRVTHPDAERSGFLFGLGQPKEFRLEQGYPNPFNAEVFIPFAIAADGAAKLEIFNMALRHEQALELEVFDAAPVDEGRPLGAGLQEQASNRLKLHRLNAVCGER